MTDASPSSREARPRPDVMLVGLEEEAGALARSIRAVEPGERQGVAEEWVSGLVADALAGGGPERVSHGAALRDVGLDSLGAVALADGLGDALDVPLDAMVAFDHPTIEALARYAVDLVEGAGTSETTPSDTTPTATRGGARTGQDIFELVETELDERAGQSD